jgi:malonyl-CoA/methylmalonyl-CoA synthetase
MTETLEIIQRAAAFADSIAFREDAREYSYNELLRQSANLSMALLEQADDLSEQRVGILILAGFEYAAAQWAIWRAGGVAVPLCLSATESELEYILQDSQVAAVVTTQELAGKLSRLAAVLSVPILIVDRVIIPEEKSLPTISPGRRAMILYTSGTTNKPKGVVSTHANIQAQIESLVQAWEWQSTDTIPLFLPMHHIHGIINVMSCALWSGATIDAFAEFEQPKILDRVEFGAYSVFMAVPTIYVKLIQALESLDLEARARLTQGFAQMRLMISGSAALPASIHEKWTLLTGQKLLERYGMTEIGMALSNPYRGERRPGAVGLPLPGVEVRLVSEENSIVTEENVPGEIQVRGPAVFLEYWNRPEATKESFLDGWFRTGDVAVLERGYYRILGRKSVDIIKSGGYKLSALEIESVLLEHPAIRECAVIGLPDETWGEAVSVVAVLRPGEKIDLDSLRAWCRDKLSAYKIPKRLVVVDALPRNAMGKVTKPAMHSLFK